VRRGVAMRHDVIVERSVARDLGRTVVTLRSAIAMLPSQITAAGILLDKLVIGDGRGVTPSRAVDMHRRLVSKTWGITL
jgi:hypothetical protein